MRSLAGPSRSSNRLSRLGYVLLCVPVHLFLITVVIAAVVTWVCFAGSYFIRATIRADWLPAYLLGPLDPKSSESTSTIEGSDGVLDWRPQPPPRYGSDPMIDQYTGFIRLKNGRLNLTYQQLKTSIWMHGHTFDEMPEPYQPKVSGDYTVIPSSERFPHRTSSGITRRLGFYWKSEGKEYSGFGYFSHLYLGATDIVEHRLSIRIGFPLWLPGIVLALTSFIYLRQRRRGWVRWRRRRKGRCLGCGYSLQGLLTDSGCPECGVVSPS